MTPGDWIALGALGMTGTGMFFTLMGVMWKWSSRIENRLASLETAFKLALPVLGEAYKFEDGKMRKV